MFNLDKARVKLKNCNCKPELHGEEHVTATYLKFEYKTANSILDMFDDKLRPALYQKESGDTQDTLIDDYLPEYKFPLLGPLTYDWEGAGYKAVVDYGVSGSDIVLPMAGVDNVSFELSDGGTVTEEFRVVCKTDALNNGRLIEMQQQEVTLTLEPPAAEE